ncbi:deoxyribodipyrimidine photo-lyase [Desulfonatronum sp. SC1]|uniref:deoxyribodipyrimidine photo-lyase n=1 Tax=Desulfonatronum sp. SC1 TaxID=2109626 RepID=UPI000D30CE20|nr:deoxyribodipyrimidine photo-lyase [Desulfonatronum sp. SC1]PTN35985.1 deoxyribodipyrimidine photolyase [Desulfonatronum sp. SC1]
MNRTQAIHPSRVTFLSQNAESLRGPVVYWMSRDQRVRDNWALLFAAELALERDVPLAVVFCLAPAFPGATIRQYGFLLKGLAEVEADLRRRNIAFVLRLGEVPQSVLGMVRELNAGVLVTDFDPLRVKRRWKEDVLAHLTVPFFEVDAHNIVPCRETSPKQEYAARTIRPKIHRKLDEFLTPFPEVPTFPAAPSADVFNKSTDWDAIRKHLQVNSDVAEVDWLRPGERGAEEMLREFLEHRLDMYSQRNDPNAPVLSNLSLYLHFGQISAQRVAWDVLRSSASAASREAFLEELIVRRELADNFCWYNQAYDRVDGFPDWARKTLDKHRADKREYIYDIQTFETAATHDPLWNAAQQEMTETGKMHGYMRMYWAKKILEWTPSPEDALEIAVLLNDKYELDGRDPNGYAGIAWSIGGVHDRPWFERSVFGQIRYMSATGCARKFDVPKYIRRFSSQ